MAYPKNKFHADLPPVSVANAEEEAKYTEANGWGDVYIKQVFPTSVYGPNGVHKTAANQADLDAALKAGFTTDAPEMAPPVNDGSALVAENARLQAQIDSLKAVEENARLKAQLAALQAASGPSQDELDAQRQAKADAADAKKAAAKK
jgi:hypothetical protein